MKLADRLSHYTSPASTVFDLDFKKITDSLCPTREENPNKSKDEIIAFINKNKARPSQSSQNIDEKRMAWRMSVYTRESQSSFDPKFKKQVENLLKQFDKK
jgi:hypothetical protein